MAHQNVTSAADGTEIAWSVHGAADGGDDEPARVLVHGITESAGSWDPLLEQLSRNRTVVTLDLRGHGESGTAGTYDLVSFAGDVAAVCAAAEVATPDLIGHSLGGIVSTAAAPLLGARSVVNVDQSLQLGTFKAQLDPIAEHLRDPDAFPATMAQLFAAVAGTRISETEFARIEALRRPDQDVVLGVWNLVLGSELGELEELVDGALAPYAENPVAYLSLFGADPGAGYGDWLAARIPGATTRLWDDHGHYPHLVDPTRFVDTVDEFHASLTA